MSKIIKTTHIDTGGHGYYSVSKKDITLLGIADKISGFSGLSLSRVYLEEDSDAALLYDRAKEMGINIVCKSGYNLKFKITHNYNPALFNYVPKTGDKIDTGGGREYQITAINEKNIFVTNGHSNYRIPLSNPFKFIVAKVN